jgi:hypothetical protein
MAAINQGGRPIGFDVAVDDNDVGKGPLAGKTKTALEAS